MNFIRRKPSGRTSSGGTTTNPSGPSTPEQSLEQIFHGDGLRVGRLIPAVPDGCWGWGAPSGEGVVGQFERGVRVEPSRSPRIESHGGREQTWGVGSGAVITPRYFPWIVSLPTNIPWPGITRLSRRLFKELEPDPAPAARPWRSPHQHLQSSNRPPRQEPIRPDGQPLGSPGPPRRRKCPLRELPRVRTGLRDVGPQREPPVCVGPKDEVVVPGAASIDDGWRRPRGAVPPRHVDPSRPHARARLVRDPRGAGVVSGRRDGFEQPDVLRGADHVEARIVVRDLL